MAGIPQSLHYDPDTREFSYRFAEEPGRDIPDPTIVFVPARRHYPGGFVIETSAGERATFDAARSRPVVRGDPAQPVHTLHIRPAS